MALIKLQMTLKNSFHFIYFIYDLIYKSEGQKFLLVFCYPGAHFKTKLSTTNRGD